MKTISVNVPDVLLLRPGESLDGLTRKSQFLLAVKFFELGDLSSGQAAQMCGMNRINFLLDLSRMGIPVTDLNADELAEEVRDV